MKRIGVLRRALVGVLLVCCAVVGLVGSPFAAARTAFTRGTASPAGGWGSAQEVPGTATLNAGHIAAVNSLSCASAGNCAAGGYYRDGSGHQQAFVVDEVSGVWGSAEEVPNTATLNTGGAAQVNSLSCASAGNCAAGGYYKDGSGHQQAFVVDEVGGVWGSAEEVPNTATLNTGGAAQVISLSCASAGNCAAGGFYKDGSGHQQAFVVDKASGVWGSAEEVPNTATLNAGAGAAVLSLSCASAGNCAAGGYYTDGSGHGQAFVVDEASGVWGSAEEVPGTPTLGTGTGATLYSLSCPSAGNCAAGGSYTSGYLKFQAFVVDEVNGTWGSAEEVPGTATLNTGSDAGVSALSCASAGNCAAGGRYRDNSGHQAFVVDEVNGTWGSAEEVPGTATLNTGSDARVSALSCASAGNCAAGGVYKESSHPPPQQVFVVDEVNGVWGSAEEVPGTATLNTGGSAHLNAISCPSAGNCAAGGDYGSSGFQAFVVNEANGTPPPTVSRLSPTKGPSSGGTVVKITGAHLTGAKAVHFGTKLAKIARLVSATVIKVTAPKGSGAVDVTVTTAGGTSAKTKADRYTYLPRPTVTKLSPNRGPSSGGTVVTITGAHLTGAKAVHFGSTLAKIVRRVSATQIKVTAPKGAGTVDVTVTTPGGTSAKTKADRFTY